MGNKITTSNEIIIKANVYPETATNKKLDWRVNPEGIVEIIPDSTTATVRVIPLKLGDCILTATSENGICNKVNITVIPPLVKINEIELDKTNITFHNPKNIDETFQINATYEPSDGSVSERCLGLKWVVLNPSVASVSVDSEDDTIAYVTGKKEGVTSLICMSKYNEEVRTLCDIFVTSEDLEASDIEIIPNKDIYMVENTTFQLGWRTVPNVISSNKDDIVFKSENELCVEVDENGLITSHGVGETTIKVYMLSNPEVCKEINVFVTEIPIYVEDFRLDNHSFEISKDEFKLINAEFLPSNANKTKVEWITDDDRIAKICEVADGFSAVYGVDKGVTTIRCRLVDNENNLEEQVCNVEVI